MRAPARDTVYVETAVCDHEVAAEDPVARFYRRDELGQDPSNWFAPNVSALSQWCASCGLEPVRVQSWPPDAPSRAMVTATVSPGEPEYRTISYERPLTVSVPGIAPRG